MPETVTMLNAAGLILNTGGSLMMGYGVLNASKAYTIRNLEDSHDAKVALWKLSLELKQKSLPSELYTPDRIAMFVREVEAGRDADLAEVALKIKKAKNEVFNSNYNWGTLGVLVLAIGFMVQLTALFWPRPCVASDGSRLKTPGCAQAVKPSESKLAP